MENMKIIITDTGTYPGKISIEDRVFRPTSNIHPCKGCFGCWCITPGVCRQKDEGQYLGTMLAKCDELIIISRCFHGSFSPFVKLVVERMLPYLQPGFEEVDGRMRHKVRYQNTIKTKVYFYEENLCDAEKALAKKMIRKEMDNFHQTNPKITWYEDAWQIGGEL
jgi:Multimeric flavodoxin WrbA